VDGRGRRECLSCHARVTSSTAAIAAKLLAKGEIRTKGIVLPKKHSRIKPMKCLMKELNEREITVVERILPITGLTANNEE